MDPFGQTPLSFTTRRADTNMQKALLELRAKPITSKLDSYILSITLLAKDLAIGKVTTINQYITVGKGVKIREKGKISEETKIAGSSTTGRGVTIGKGVIIGGTRTRASSESFASTASNRLQPITDASNPTGNSPDSPNNNSILH